MYFMSIGDLIVSVEKNWVMVGFAFLSFIMSLAGLMLAKPSGNKQEDDPWNEIDIHAITIDKSDF